jgi:hypothetical protein
MTYNPWLFTVGVALVSLCVAYVLLCAFLYWLDRAGIVFNDGAHYTSTKQEQEEAKQRALAYSAKVTARMISFWPLTALTLVVGIILIIVDA